MGINIPCHEEEKPLNDYQKVQITSLRNVNKEVREINRMFLISSSNVSDVLCTCEVHCVKKKRVWPKKVEVTVLREY